MGQLYKGNQLIMETGAGLNIHDLTEKQTLSSNDEFVISDSDNTYDNKKIKIASLASKSSPANNDFLLIGDSADTNKIKKITYQNIVGALPTLAHSSNIDCIWAGSSGEYSALQNKQSGLYFVKTTDVVNSDITITEIHLYDSQVVYPSSLPHAMDGAWNRTGTQLWQINLGGTATKVGFKLGRWYGEDILIRDYGNYTTYKTFTGLVEGNEVYIDEVVGMSQFSIQFNSSTTYWHELYLYYSLEED